MRLKGWLSTAVLTFAIQAFMGSTAWAHHVTISASAVCVGADAVINYTSVSWSPNAGEGENPEIDIRFNGVKVGQGAYVFATGNQFSGSAPAPSGATADVSAIAVGVWGDGFGGGEQASVTVTIPTDCVVSTGRFTGGGKQIDINGIAITKGLTIHCDLLLSNNLEINWNGHQFHMEEHTVTISCTDDPSIDQKPPAAPLDTLVGIGLGRYDNNDGYTVEFTLVDAGEPGKTDQAALKIYETANPVNVVLNLPLTYLTGGNLQAHYDQPHK
jgi:hypothetical protein